MAVLNNEESISSKRTNYQWPDKLDWLESNMADHNSTDISDGMMPDEMFEVLQHEMDSIKEDQQALKDEINDIKAQFFNLIHSCAFDDSNLSMTASLVPEVVCESPQQVKGRTATPGKDPSPKHNPVKGGCSYGDKLIQMMLEMPSNYLDDTDLSESPPLPNQSKDDPSDQQQSVDNVKDDNSERRYSSSKKYSNAEILRTETPPTKALEPVKLNFEDCIEKKSEVRKVQTGADVTVSPENFINKPMHDSIGFNPASVLNSTSICVFDESKSMVNCTPAGLNCTSADPYTSRLSLGCPSALINPASVLNCTPLEVNTCDSMALPYVNPASVLDYPPHNNQTNPGQSYSSYSNVPRNVHVSQDTSRFSGNQIEGDKSTSDSIASSEYSYSSDNAQPPSRQKDNASLIPEPPSIISYNSELMAAPSVLQSNSEQIPPVRDLNETSQIASMSRSMYLKQTENSLNITPAVNVPPQPSYAVHSTPAVHNGRSNEHFFNPTCSAIVNYSVSSSESDQSGSVSSSSRDHRSSVGDLSDTQPVLDRQQEMMSRMKYYSDFTVDRRWKMKKLRDKRLDLTTCPEYGVSSQGDVPNDTMCRYVEGAEDQPHQVCLIAPPYSRSSSLGSSSSGGSSTLQKTAVTLSRNSNSPSPMKSCSKVLQSTENTQHLTPVPVSDKCQRTSSTTSGNSTSPPSSIYAWSSSQQDKHHHSERSSHSHRHKRSRGDKRPRSSRHRSSHHRSEERHAFCRDHDVHTMLGQPCNQVIKYLPVQPYFTKDLILSNDSLYDDGYKSQTLPRSSTKKSLNPSSNNSSLEAKRNSVPDICALKSPPNSALISSGSDTMSFKYPPGRKGCIGMSTSESQGSPTGTDSSKGRRSSSIENNENTALTDSILTDSPKSVSSSGIFAPCNSPDATVGSRISCSTIADSQYIDLKGISVIQPNTSALSGISAIPSSSIASEFKVPKVPAPKKSHRRKGNRCSTPDVRTSTPKPNSYPNSVQSEKVSCRKLFSSSSSTHSSNGSSSRLLDKRSVMKKFRRFSENFYKSKSGKVQIETLANL